jgi:membrane fusion protein (multidrug efflux system)
MRIGVILAGAVVAIAIGFGYVYSDALAPLWRTYILGEPAPTQETATPAGGFAVPVEAVTVAVERVDLTIPAVGSLRSNESVVLSPEIAGRVNEILADEGQAVTAGTVIARLDQSVYKAEIAEIEANLALSRANFKRADELLRKKAGTARARDEAEAELRANEAKLVLAQAMLDKTVIDAPFAGVLGLRSVSAGQYLAPGDPIFKLEAIDPLKVDFRVPEIYLTQVRTGQALQITLDALPERAYAGQVYAINPLLDAAGRAIVIRATVPNADGKLRPGMFARVRLLTSEVKDALMIPEESLFPVGEDKYVYRVVDGRARRQKVDIGLRRDAKVEIVGGLAAGDVVVTAGQPKIRDGAPVKVANATEAPGAAPAPKVEAPAKAKGS